MNALSEQNRTEQLLISLSGNFWLATLALLASSIQMSKKWNQFSTTNPAIWVQQDGYRMMLLSV